MAHGNAKYDDDRLVQLIAEAELSYAAIGADVGLSESMVGRVARGEYRTELQPLITAIREGFADEARRLAARSARGAVATLVELTHDSGQPGDVRRKAAGDILSHAIGDPSRTQVNVSQQQAQGPDLAGLSAETKQQVLAELGGPAE